MRQSRCSAWKKYGERTRSCLAALRPTPAISWPLLAERLGAEAVVKHENHLPTGAFKVRGGLTYVDALIKREPKARGLISATRGNHGQSLAFAGRRAGLEVTILAPEGNSIEKNAAMRALGADLIESGRDFQAAREEAMRLADERGLHIGSFFPSGSCARRLDLCARAAERPPRPQRSLRADRPGVGNLRLHRCARRFGAQDGYCRRPVGGSAGLCTLVRRRPRGADQQRRHICRRHGDARSRRGGACSNRQGGGADRARKRRGDRLGHPRLLDDTHNLAEGAGAAALAAAMQERSRLNGRKIGLVLSGGNIDFDLFRRWVDSAPDAAAA